MQFFIADRQVAIRMGKQARRFIEDNQPHENDIYSTILQDKFRAEKNACK